MLLREHQIKSIQKDLSTTVFVIVIITLVFGFYLVHAPNSAVNTAVSFAVFFILNGLYVLSSNIGLVKVARAEIERQNLYIWILPSLLFLILLIYFLTLGYSFVFMTIAPIFCLVPVFFSRLIAKQGAKPHLLDIFIIFLIWVPSVFVSISPAGLPPVQPFIDLYDLASIVLLVYIYVVIREIPFSLRIKFADVRFALYGFMAFMVLALILVFAAGTMEMPRYSPTGTLFVARVIIFAFFIALPEEILYRGVVLQFLSQCYPFSRGRNVIPLILSAIIFAAAHIPGSRFFDVLIYSGSPFSHQAAGLRFLLMLLAGLFYGWVYLRTKKVAASAVMHFLVLWFWVTLLNG